MKVNHFLAIIVLAFLASACKSAPTIDEVESSVADDVEELLMEDNNDEKYFRMDRFFLNENPNPLVYTGVLKATYFYKNRTGKWDARNLRWIPTQDSLKMYRDVTIKFRDNKYDQYTIEIAAPEQ